MDRPGELIRRASIRPGWMPHQPPQEKDEELIFEENLPAPQPVSRHASYTALMRSHDRVHTRHITDKR